MTRRAIGADHDTPDVPPCATRFEADFSRIAGAKLLAMLPGAATLVSLEVYTFSEAWCVLWRAAKLFGALHLSPETQAELVDWLDCELLARIDDPAAPGSVTPQRLSQITGET